MTVLGSAALLAAIAMGAIGCVHTRNVVRWWSDGDLELKTLRAASVAWFAAAIMVLGWVAGSGL